MHKIKDLCVVTRSYSQNGLEKKVWKNVGGVFVNDDGNERIAIDAFFNFSALKQDNSDLVWLSAFPVKPKDSQQNNSYQPYSQPQSFDSNASLPDGEPPF